MWMWILGLFGGKGNFIKWMVIAAIVITAGGWLYHRDSSQRSAIHDLQQNNEILTKNVEILKGANDSNVKVNDFLSNNFDFLQILDKESEVKKEEKTKKKQVVKEAINTKTKELGDHSVSPLLGQSLNLLDPMDKTDVQSDSKTAAGTN